MGLILWSLLPFANSEQNRSQMQLADAQASSSSALEVTVRLAGNRQRLLALSEQMAEVEAGLKQTEQQLLEESSCRDC